MNHTGDIWSGPSEQGPEGVQHACLDVCCELYSTPMREVDNK